MTGRLCCADESICHCERSVAISSFPLTEGIASGFTLAMTEKGFALPMTGRLYRAD